MATTYDIQLTRDGHVTSRNHRRLGYERLLQGAFGRLISSDDIDPFHIRRQQIIMKAQAAVRLIGDHRVCLYGSTAFQVLGVALPAALEDWQSCHLSIAPGNACPRRRGVTGHRPEHPWQVWRHVAGLPLLHPIDHLLQLPDATIDQLVEVGDGLLRRRNPLLSLAQCQQRLSQIHGRRGITRLRKAIRLMTPGTDSLYETRTRLLLIRAGLPTPEVNLAVPCRSANRVYHVDLGYPQERVAVEFDGVVHVGNRKQMEIDAIRRRQLQDDGWMIITITSEQLLHPRQIINSVEAALVTRRAEIANRLH